MRHLWRYLFGIQTFTNRTTAAFFQSTGPSPMSQGSVPILSSPRHGITALVDGFCPLVRCPALPRTRDSSLRLTSCFCYLIKDSRRGPGSPSLAMHPRFVSLFSFAFFALTVVSPARLAAQLAAEWRIEIPGAGVLQALFTVARFEPVNHDSRTFALGLRLAGKPAFSPEPPV